MQQRGLFLLVVASVAAGCTPAPTEDAEGESTDVDDGDGSTDADDDAIGDSTDADGDSSGTPDDADAESSSDSGDALDCDPLPPGTPPAVIVEDATLVPIDALSVAATLRFDVAAQTATGTATLEFALGPEGGMPIFDLRQPITAVALDGADLGANAAPFFQPSDDIEARMRAVTETLAPCSEHTLVVEYAVALPDASNSEAPMWDPAGVIWNSRHSDLWPGRYAEQWWPMNLPHDEVAMTIDVEVVNAPGPHVVAANGDVTSVGDAHWQVAFPPDYTSLSPLLVVAPAALAEVTSSAVDLPEGVQITIDVVRLTSYVESSADLIAEASAALVAADLELGDYPHGDRFLVWASGLEGGMEYEGATGATLGSMRHEVFHSWIGRSLRPLAHRDGWLDEAWTTFAIDRAYAAEPLPADAPVEMLAPADPWTRRTTSPGAYVTGPRVFATVAAEIGVDALRGLLRDFYAQHAEELVTTEEVEHFLVCATEGEVVHASFSRFVHGLAVPAGPVDRSECP
jgi:hypothetical protein